MPQTDSKSASGQEQKQTVQMAPYTPHFEDETIDLYELWILLWNRKWMVVALTLVTALGSILYSRQLQHIYIADALLLPPKDKDVQLMNVLAINRDDRELLIETQSIFEKTILAKQGQTIDFSSL